jgi:hypothetical protein
MTPHTPPCPDAKLGAGGTPAHVTRGLQIFVLIDALGWEYVKNREFLSDVLPYRQPLRTVLGYSSGAIPTILTGLMPAQNGHWNLLYYDPQGSPFRWLRHLEFLPGTILEHRVTRKLLKEMGHRMLGLGPLFDCTVSTRLLRWFNWVERRNIYGYGGITGTLSIFDHLAQAHVPHRIYTFHKFTDIQILDRARRDMETDKSGVFFLYLSEMDMFLHKHCLDTAEIDQQVRWYGERLASLFRFARKIDPEAGLTIFSDHGMAPVRQLYDVVGEIDALGFRTPEDYLAVYDSTMARFWFFADTPRKKITERLLSMPCGRILSDAEMESLGILFEDRRYGELVMLLHPGGLMGKSDFNGPRWVPAGMHGYHPDDPDSDAIFLSSRAPVYPLRTIADVHRCLLAAVS